MDILLLFTVTITMAVSILIALQEKDLFSPIMLFSCPIMISVICNEIYYSLNNDIKGKTYFIYWLSFISFVFGYMLAMVIFRTLGHNHSVIKERKLYCNLLIYRLYWAFAIIGTFFSIRFMVEGALSGVFGNNIIRNIRYYSLYMGENSFLGKYAIIFSSVIMLYNLYERNVLLNRTLSNKSELIIAFILTLINICTSFSRTTILSISLEIGFFYCIYLKMTGRLNGHAIKSLAKITLAVIVVIVIFNFLAVQTNKSQGLTGESWFLFYFGAEINVLDKYIIDKGWHFNGLNSLGIIPRILNTFGVYPSGNSAEYSVYQTSIGGLVSSFASGPYMDFGILGCLIIPCIYGYIISYIHERHKQLGGLWTIANATCLYQCAIAFFAFQFGMSDQVYIIALFLLMCKCAFVTKESKVQ